MMAIAPMMPLRGTVILQRNEESLLFVFLASKNEKRSCCRRPAVHFASAKCTDLCFCYFLAFASSIHHSLLVSF
jgi:hypothetical protein